jgi:hypothetical protein
MLTQIRIYTINKGEMDNFLKHFKEEIMPLHEKIGVPIVGTWVNRPQNEFIWVRTYKDKAELEAKTKSCKPRSRPPVSNSEATLRRWKCAKSNRRLRRSGFAEGKSLATIELHNGAKQENHRAACDCHYMRSSGARFWLSGYEERSAGESLEYRDSARRRALKLGARQTAIGQSSGFERRQGGLQQRHSLPDRNRHVARQQAVKITWNVHSVHRVVNALEVQK